MLSLLCIIIEHFRITILTRVQFSWTLQINSHHTLKLPLFKAYKRFKVCSLFCSLFHKVLSAYTAVWEDIVHLGRHSTAMQKKQVVMKGMLQK